MDRPPLESFFIKSPLQKEDVEVSDDAVVKKLRGAKGDRGEKGEKGDSPEVEELEAIILTLIPDAIPGKDGKDGTDGKNGERGERGFVGEKGEPGTDGRDGVDGKDGDSTDISGKEVVEKINKSRGEKIKRSKVEGFDDIESLARSAQKQIQNFISLGGNRQTKLQLNGGIPLTGVDTINFIGGTLTPVGDGSTASYTPPSTGGGSGYQAATGVVNGINQVFTFATAPSAIVVDEGRVIQKVASDGTVNWTGTTVVTLSVAPNSDIFAIG